MMMGPAPMIKMLSMSLRLGILLLHHQRYETVEQIRNVMRPRASLRVTLKTKRRAIGSRQALQRAVEQADMGSPQMGGQALFIDSEAMVLASDADTPAVQIFHRVIG